MEENDSRNAAPKLLYRSLLLMGVSQQEIRDMEAVFAAKLMACPPMTTEKNLLAMENLANESVAKAKFIVLFFFFFVNHKHFVVEQFCDIQQDLYNLV
jgi:hypothetical protein